MPNASNYQLSYRRVADQTWITNNGNQYTRLLNTLTPCSEYEVRLRARCGNNVYSDYAVTFYFHTQNIYAPLTVDLGPDTSFHGQPFCITLDAGNPGMQYLWSTGETTQTISYCPINSEKISVQVLNNNCIVGVDTIHIKYISDFDKIFEIQDRWGKKYTLSDITYVDTLTPNIGQRVIVNSENSCLIENGPNHARFRIIFEDVVLNNNFGFDDDSRNVTVFVGSQPQTMTIGAARRRVVCQTFDDISRLLLTPETTPDYVNILIKNSSDVDPNASFAANASPYLVLPVTPTPNTIIYGETAKTIQSGKDSYAEILQNLNANPFLYYGQSRIYYFHGEIRYNFRSPSFDLFVDFDRLSPLPSLGEVDMYSVTLHEIQHLLGFASKINQNGNSNACVGCYSKYDTFLKGREILDNTYQNLITSSGCYNNQPSTRMFNQLDVVNIHCAPAPPAITFEGNYAHNIPVLTGGNPSRMSHFYSHPDCNQNCHYTICFSISGGEASYKRTMLDDEVNVLCDLGYQLDSDYGYDDCPNGFFQNTQSSRPSRYQTYSPCQPCNPIGRVDTGIVELNVNRRFYPLLNDVNAHQIDCVELIYGRADVTGTPFYVDVTPRNEATNIVIRYIPKSGNCAGAETYIVLKVKGNEPVINLDTVRCAHEGNPCSELVCNGSMENFFPYEASYVEPHYRFLVNNALNSPEILLDGVPQSINAESVEYSCIQPNPPLIPAHGGDIKTQLFLWNAYDTLGRSRQQEGMVFRLNVPLRQNGKYRFSMWTRNVDCPENPALIVGFSKQYPCQNGISIRNGIIENGLCQPGNLPFSITMQRRWGHNDLIPSRIGWQELTWEFCAADSNNGDEYIYVFIDADRNHPPAFSLGFVCFIDDVSLLPDPSGSVTISTNPAPPVKCPDGCVELTANASGIPCQGIPTFSWSPSIGLNTTEGNIVQACATTTQTYTVTATTPNGCTSTASVTVTVNPLLAPPPITTEIQTPIICGDTSLITAKTVPNAVINWQGAPFLVCNERGDTCRAFPRQPGNYQYYVSATIDGCTARDTVDLTVLPLQIVIDALTTNICVNTPLNLNVSSNVPGVTYTWDNLQHLSCNPNRDQCQFQSGVTGTFRYIVTGQRGNFCMARDTIDITVFNTSNGGVINNPQTICAGDIPNPLILSGYGNGTIQRWESQDGCTGIWQQITNTQFFYQPPALYNTTCYRAIVSNAGCGEAFSATYTLTVNSTKGGMIIDNQTICTGTIPQPLTLTNHNGSVLRWEFSTNNGITWNIIPHTLTTYTPSALTQTTQYRALVRFNPCTVETSAVATVTIIPLPNGGATRLQQTEVCLNGTANLYLDAYSGTVMQWEYAPNCAGPWTTVPSNLPTFSRVLTQATCFRALVGRQPCPPSYSEQVNIAPTACSPCDTAAPTRFFSYESGFCNNNIYWFEGIYNCLHHHGSSYFVSFGKDYYVWSWDTTGMSDPYHNFILAYDRFGQPCYGENGYCEVLAGDTIGYDDIMMFWYNNPSKSFRVIGKNFNNGCTDTNYVYIHGIPDGLNTRPPDDAICENAGTILDMRDYSAPNRHYFYWEPMTGVTFLDSLNGPRVLLNPPTTTTYTFYRYSFRGFYENHRCEQCWGGNVDTTRITVNPNPTGITYIANPGEIEVTSVTGGTPPYLYQAIGQNDQIPFLPNPILGPLQGGNYEVSVKDANGCIYAHPSLIAARMGDFTDEPEPDIRLYPNPAQDFITLSYQVKKEPSSDIEVHNSLGAVIYRLKISRSGEYDIDTQLWAAGMYFVNVKNQSGHVFYRAKLIIAK